MGFHSRYSIGDQLVIGTKIVNMILYQNKVGKGLTESIEHRVIYTLKLPNGTTTAVDMLADDYGLYGSTGELDLPRGNLEAPLREKDKEIDRLRGMITRGVEYSHEQNSQIHSLRNEVAQLRGGLEAYRRELKAAKELAEHRMAEIRITQEMLKKANDDRLSPDLSDAFAYGSHAARSDSKARGESADAVTSNAKTEQPRYWFGDFMHGQWLRDKQGRLTGELSLTSIPGTERKVLYTTRFGLGDQVQSKQWSRRGGITKIFIRGDVGDGSPKVDYLVRHDEDHVVYEESDLFLLDPPKVDTP